MLTGSGENLKRGDNVTRRSIVSLVEGLLRGHGAIAFERYDASFFVGDFGIGSEQKEKTLQDRPRICDTTEKSFVLRFLLPLTLQLGINMCQQAILSLQRGAKNYQELGTLGFS